MPTDQEIMQALTSTKYEGCTKGEWYRKEGYSYDAVCYSKDGECVAEVVHDTPNAVTMADAKLNAAARLEMTKALQLLRNSLPCVCFEKEINFIDKAIAKWGLTKDENNG